MSSRRLARCVSALFLAALAPAVAHSEQIIREQRAVTVAGIKEVWQLLWDGMPSSVCGPGEMLLASTCPCAGLAYGEYGKLSLIRKRGDLEIERMDLRPLFENSYWPEQKWQGFPG